MWDVQYGHVALCMYVRMHVGRAVWSRRPVHVCTHAHACGTCMWDGQVALVDVCACIYVHVCMAAWPSCLVALRHCGRDGGAIHGGQKVEPRQEA